MSKSQNETELYRKYLQDKSIWTVKKVSLEFNCIYFYLLKCILTWNSTHIDLHPCHVTKMPITSLQADTEIFNYNYMKMNSSIKAPLRQQTPGMGVSLAPNLHREFLFRGQSKLLQQLPKIGGLGELSADSRQLVKNRTVQGHTGNQPLCTTTTVPTDLNTQYNKKKGC